MLYSWNFRSCQSHPDWTAEALPYPVRRENRRVIYPRRRHSGLEVKLKRCDVIKTSRAFLRVSVTRSPQGRRARFHRESRSDSPMCSRSANWLSRSRAYPGLPEIISSCLPEREVCRVSLVTELKRERSVAAFRQAAKWLVISASFHKCRVPFLFETENSAMRLQCRIADRSSQWCVGLHVYRRHITRRSGLSLAPKPLWNTKVD